MNRRCFITREVAVFDFDADVRFQNMLLFSEERIFDDNKRILSCLQGCVADGSHRWENNNVFLFFNGREKVGSI